MFALYTDFKTWDFPTSIFSSPPTLTFFPLSFLDIDGLFPTSLSPIPVPLNKHLHLLLLKKSDYHHQLPPTEFRTSDPEFLAALYE